VLEGLTAGDVVLLGSSPAPGRRARAELRASTAAPGAKGSGDAGAAISSTMGR
jgi:hypothetical protein